MAISDTLLKMRIGSIIVWSVLGLLSPTLAVACVKPALLDQADESQREALLKVDHSCKKGIELLHSGHPLEALEQLKQVATKGSLLNADIDLLIAEVMYQAGLPVDQTLAAWEAVRAPAQLVHARRFELVQRLPMGIAAQLLAENLKRPTHTALRARVRRDELGLAKAQRKVTANYLGVLLPLSGKFKGVGQAILRNIRLGLDKKTRLIVRDTAGRADNMVNHISELEQRGVVGIIGPVDRNAANEAARIANERHIPILRLSVEEPLTTEIAETDSQNGESNDPNSPSQEWSFRAFLSLRSQCRVLVKYAHRRRLKRWAILHADSPFGIKIARSCQIEIEAAGGKVS
ncbi:MAG TPA: hypothetical protein EYN66_05295, partial [Myxococcales bacterium]|nr:hypothetical protein [Myxococcales bacterium]